MSMPAARVRSLTSLDVALELRAVRREQTALRAVVAELGEQIQAMRCEVAVLLQQEDPWSDELTTSQALVFCRRKRPRFARTTLYRWLAEGLVSDIAHPRRWRRRELELALRGVPQSGRRQRRRFDPAFGAQGYPAPTPASPVRGPQSPFRQTGRSHPVLGGGAPAAPAPALRGPRRLP